MRSIILTAILAGTVSAANLTTFGIEEVKSSNADKLYNSYYNLSGDGVVVGIIDAGKIGYNVDGVIVDHASLKGRVNNSDNSSDITDEHSTHVAGIIGGSDINHKAVGIAPNVYIESLSYHKSSIGMNLTFLNSKNIYISNNSYGRGYDSDYNSGAQYIDMFINNDSNNIAVFAAGNNGRDGFNTISRASTSKNVLTIGSIGNEVNVEIKLDKNYNPLYNDRGELIYSCDIDDKISYFSSKGPTSDGRIKPDIVTKGVHVYSAVSNERYFNEDGFDCEFDYKQGTSMATPVATGNVALLTEYYKKINGKLMRADVVKALLTGSADDRGLVGPDYSFGFGELNAYEAVKIIDTMNTDKPLLQTGLVSNGSSDTYELNIGSDKTVKLTLSWLDTMDNIFNRSIVNTDLDLSIVDESGKVYYSYSCNSDTPTEPATAIDYNRVDNVEQIVTTLPKGSYKVIVNGFNVKENQNYTIVTSDYVKKTDTKDFNKHITTWF